MKRVAIYIDGKNHMKDIAGAARNRWIDHRTMFEWLVSAVGGDDLASVHYYTGVPNPVEDASTRRSLTELLRRFEDIPGVFVHRYPRQTANWACSGCGTKESFTREKCVDTAMVADLVLHGARGAYDEAIVLSGDMDFVPGLDAVHALGKKAWVATFGHIGISKTLTRAAWGSLDLAENLDAFSEPLVIKNDGPVTDDDGEFEDEADAVFLELRRAEVHFGGGGGFVGAHYFIHRWKANTLSDEPEWRRKACERLVRTGRVEMYEVGGKTALRTLVAPVQVADVLNEEELMNALEES